MKELGGTHWQFDMQLLRQLETKSDDAELQVSRAVRRFLYHAMSCAMLSSQAKWLDVKFQKKKALAAYLKRMWGFDIDPTTMFDIQIKRIHECVHPPKAPICAPASANALLECLRTKHCHFCTARSSRLNCVGVFVSSPEQVQASAAERSRRNQALSRLEEGQSGRARQVRQKDGFVRGQGGSRVRDALFNYFFGNIWHQLLQCKVHHQAHMRHL
jgi:hypothetical protein